MPLSELCTFHLNTEIHNMYVECSTCGCVVRTFTDSGLSVERVTSGTFTLEAAKGVDAISSLAQSW